MVHIKKIVVSDATTIWKLEGSLAGDAIDATRREFERFTDPARRHAGAQPARLYLDLGGIRFMDESGIALLRERLSLLAGIIDCQEYVRSLLYEHGLQKLLLTSAGDGSRSRN
jgi:STAS domain-containing protein